MKKLIIVFAAAAFLISCSKTPPSTTTGGNTSTGGGGSDTSNAWIKLPTIIPLSNSLGILCMCIDNNNNLYVAGSLYDGLDGYFVAKWNGSAWSKVGTGATALHGSSWITQICADNNGNIYVLTGSGGSQYIAKWNGSNWASIGSLNAITAGAGGSGYYDGNISSMVNDNQNNIYISADNDNPYDSIQIFKWNGSNWNKLGKSLTYGTALLCTDVNGGLYFTGYMGSVGAYLAQWNGANWTVSSGVPTNDGNYQMTSFCSSITNGLFCIAPLSIGGDISVWNWKNNVWSDTGAGIGYSTALGPICSDDSGNVYLARQSTPAGNNLFYVAKYNGNGWDNISSAIPNNYDMVNGFSGIDDIAVDKLGNIYAATNSDSSNVFMLKK